MKKSQFPLEALIFGLQAPQSPVWFHFQPNNVGKQTGIFCLLLHWVVWEKNWKGGLPFANRHFSTRPKLYNVSVKIKGWGWSHLFASVRTAFIEKVSTEPCPKTQPLQACRGEESPFWEVNSLNVERWCSVRNGQDQEEEGLSMSRGVEEHKFTFGWVKSAVPLGQHHHISSLHWLKPNNLWDAAPSASHA